MLAPARIPVAAGKKMEKTEKNVVPLKSGPMFSHMIEPDRKIEVLHTVPIPLQLTALGVIRWYRITPP